MLRDALLAWAHFLCVFALASVIVAEIILYRSRMSSVRLAQLQRVDLWFGVIAGLVIVTGISRAIWGLKGPEYYLHNPIFWMKMALFVAIGLLSIAPTMHYLRVKRYAAPDGSVTVSDGTYRVIHGMLIAEGVLLIFIPLCATLMAHGYH